MVELGPVHLRHHDVGNHEPHILIVPVQLQSLLAIGSQQHRVAEALQNSLRSPSDGLLVFHHENGLRTAGDILRLLGRHGEGYPLSVGGEVNLHRGSLAQFALHVNEASVLLHQAVDHRHAEARSVPSLLGGEERLENLRQHLLIHSGAGVGRREANVLTGIAPAVLCPVRRIQPRVPRLQAQYATVRHGVSRVGRQIDHDLLNSPGIGLNLGEGQVVLHLDFDRFRKERPQGGHEVLQQFSDVHRLRRELNPAAEAQEALDHRTAAPRRRLQFLQIGARARRIRRQRGLDESCVRQYHREQVVEVVRHAAGELTYQLHLLCMPELLLECALLAHVLDEHLIALGPA